MPQFEINQRYFLPGKCAACFETLCGLLRFTVRLDRNTQVDKKAVFVAFDIDQCRGHG